MRVFSLEELNYDGNHWINFFKQNESFSKFRLVSFEEEGKEVDSYAGKLSEYIKFLGVKLRGVYLVSYLGFSFFPLGVFFRSVSEKSFSQEIVHKPMYYPSTLFEKSYKSFKYGDPIVLTEGVLDIEAFSKMVGYKYGLSVQTSAVSEGLADFISVLTNKVILLMDMDKWGRRGASESIRKLESRKVKVKNLEVPLGKDFYEFYEKSSSIEKKNFVSSFYVSL